MNPSSMNPRKFRTELKNAAKNMHIVKQKLATS